VPFGEYRVALSRLPENTYLKSIRMDNTDVRLSGFHVDGQSRGGIEIILGTNPGIVEGIAVNEKGDRAPNVTVALIPSQHAYPADLYRGASTDDSGVFRFQDVSPGEYKVMAFEDSEDGSWQDPDFVRKYEDRGKAIHIDEGSKESIQVRTISER